MARTSEDLVMDIIEVQSDDSLDMFIRTATSYVDSVFAPAAVYTSEHLLVMETWLAAHFYCILRPQLYKWETDSAVDTYEPIKVDLGLNVTKYGQQVLALDFKKVAPTVKRVTVGINWLGRERTVTFVP